MVPPVTIRAELDLAALPQTQAVYLIWPREGRPHLGRTNVLRRRLTRIFEKWKLGGVVDRVEYWLTASRLEQWLLSYRLARTHFPEDYDRVVRLPKPSYVRLILSNEYPRTQVTTRVAGRGVFYGPFAARSAADQFESQMLDLFQLRRCQEDLTPSQDHPGCIYGEMLKCLRPCQQAVTVQEYASEAGRVSEFLSGRGERMLEAMALARTRASEELRFEEAAREHSRYERIQHVVRTSGELARDVTRLYGIAITKSVQPLSVLLWFFTEGAWHVPAEFSVAPVIGKPVPLDTRLRELVGSAAPLNVTTTERQEHLALLAKWFYSSWRDGEWLTVEDWPDVPYRRLVNAVHRVIREVERKHP